MIVVAMATARSVLSDATILYPWSLFEALYLSRLITIKQRPTTAL